MEWAMATLAHGEKNNFPSCGDTELDIPLIEEDQKDEDTSMRLCLYGIQIATIAHLSYYKVNKRIIPQNPFSGVYEESLDPTDCHEH